MLICNMMEAQIVLQKNINAVIKKINFMLKLNMMENNDIS